MEQDMIINRINRLFQMARNDQKYAAMTKEYAELEKAFGSIADKMTGAQQDILWGFVCLSDAMNWRMMELLCENYNIDS